MSERARASERASVQYPVTHDDSRLSLCGHGKPGNWDSELSVSLAHCLVRCDAVRCEHARKSHHLRARVSTRNIIHHASALIHRTSDGHRHNVTTSQWAFPRGGFAPVSRPTHRPGASSSGPVWACAIAKETSDGDIRAAPSLLYLRYIIVEIAFIRCYLQVGTGTGTGTGTGSSSGSGSGEPSVSGHSGALRGGRGVFLGGIRIGVQAVALAWATPVGECRLPRAITTNSIRGGEGEEAPNCCLRLRVHMWHPPNNAAMDG